MRLLHINTMDNIGGAARAAHRLHTGLRRRGFDSSMFVAKRSSDDPAAVAFKPSTGLPGRLRRRLLHEWITRSLARYRTSRPSGYELFSDDRTMYGRALVEQLLPCDVVNLHWVAGLLDYQSFFSRVPEDSPVVWTLHDMNPFTGGCHYDDGCGKFKQGCGACPQLGSEDKGDLSRRIWQRKKKAVSQVPPGRLHLVTPSRWLATEVQRSTLLGDLPVSVIPYALDTEVFAPREGAVARAALRVPPEASVVLFVSHGVDNRRKGLALLVEALSRLADIGNLFLLTLGQGQPALDLPFPHLHLGSLDNDHLLPLIYSAADLFVIPSLQDNLPNTVLESLACSTPVVGFNVGGIPDMVRPGETGMLAPAGDVAALANAISQLLQDDDMRTSMSETCRRVAVEQYRLDVQARRYAELYDSLVRQ